MTVKELHGLDQRIFKVTDCLPIFALSHQPLISRFLNRSIFSVCSSEKLLRRFCLGQSCRTQHVPVSLCLISPKKFQSTESQPRFEGARRKSSDRCFYSAKELDTLSTNTTNAKCRRNRVTIVQLLLLLLKQTTFVYIKVKSRLIDQKLSIYTGWPEKVSHYQMIKNRIMSYQNMRMR